MQEFGDVDAQQSPGRRANLLGLFRRASQLMVDELVGRLAAAGYDDLPAAYHPVFENIDRDGTRLTVLAVRADMTHQSMSELVGTLEIRGYLQRLPDATDRRARLVALTAKGRQMVRTALVEIAAIEDAWLDRLSSPENPLDVRATLARAVALARSSTEAPQPRHRAPAARSSPLRYQGPGKVG